MINDHLIIQRTIGVQRGKPPISVKVLKNGVMKEVALGLELKQWIGLQQQEMRGSYLI